MKFKLLYFAFLILLTELLFRMFFCISWDIPFFRMNEMILHYYPELRGVKQKMRNDKGIKVLILGGSVMNKHYCDMQTQLSRSYAEAGGGNKLSVYNLAQYGQTTLDSRVKVSYLKDIFVDYYLFYHGINDTRANNIPPENFDKNYRHFDYYNYVFIYESHPELPFTVIPYTFHFLYAKVAEIVAPKPKVPPYYIVVKDSVINASFWEHGHEIKTVKTFKQNLSKILQVAQSHKGSQVILATFAHYHVQDYSLKKFYRKELDYAEQQWPTEIYGKPENVERGIIAHNRVTRSFKNMPGVRFIDFDTILPHSRMYFHDICHMTDAGCAMLAAEAAKIIASDNGTPKSDF